MLRLLRLGGDTKLQGNIAQSIFVRSIGILPGHKVDGGVGAPHVVGGPTDELRVVCVLYVRHLKY